MAKRTEINRMPVVGTGTAVFGRAWRVYCSAVGEAAPPVKPFRKYLQEMKAMR